CYVRAGSVDGVWGGRQAAEVVGGRFVEAHGGRGEAGYCDAREAGAVLPAEPDGSSRGVSSAEACALSRSSDESSCIGAAASCCERGAPLAVSCRNAESGCLR